MTGYSSAQEAGALTDTGCAKCGGAMERHFSAAVGPILHCRICGRSVATRALRALKLPGLQPGRQAVAVRELEEPIVLRITRTLRLAGYEVLCTVHRHTRHTCSQCGRNEWHRGGYGADRGIPDLLVRHPKWPRAVWLGVEVKGNRTRLSPEQKALEEAGAIVVARSEEEALAAVREADKRFAWLP